MPIKRPDIARAVGAPPRRRDFLAGAGVVAVAAAASCVRAVRPTPRRLEQPIIVDIHCHDFNASDLPITGFIARTIPGLSDFSRTLTSVPEQIVRRIVGTVHGLLNAAAPTAAEEQTELQRVLQVVLRGVPRGAPPDGDGDTAVAPVPPFAPPLAPLDALADQMAMLFHLDARAMREGLVRLAETLYLVGHGRARIAASLATIYPAVSLFTPLLVDYDAWADDHPASPLVTQIPVQELIAKLSIWGRIGRPGARVHPFIAFDPLREIRRAWPVVEPSNAGPAATPVPAPKSASAPAWETPAATLAEDAGGLAIVRQAIEQAGFIGVKVYPTVGFLPLGNDRFAGDIGHGRGRALDQSLRALYAYCQAEEIPITTHASPTNEFALGFGALAAPECWRPVLREFPGLRLNFGHFGHDNGADGARGVEAREAWMRQAAALIDDHAHVYADLSNSPLVYDAAYATRWGAHLQALCARFRRLPTRLMYGSDWWPNRFEPGAASAVAVFARKLEDWLGPRARDDVMGRNALRFLGFIDDDDRILATNRNRERLRRFYGAEPLPIWLA